MLSDAVVSKQRSLLPLRRPIFDAVSGVNEAPGTVADPAGVAAASTASPQVARLPRASRAVYLDC